jgi:hypothetical protein
MHGENILRVQIGGHPDGEWQDNVWPWPAEFDKREKHGQKRSLEIAGALIAAELDRIERINEIEVNAEEL